MVVAIKSVRKCFVVTQEKSCGYEWHQLIVTQRSSASITWKQLKKLVVSMHIIGYNAWNVLLAGCPAILRADHGTEDVGVASVQIALRYFHQDALGKEKSFIYGPSKFNIVRPL
jgi:hypothetical protein